LSTLSDRLHEELLDLYNCIQRAFCDSNNYRTKIEKK